MRLNWRLFDGGADLQRGRRCQRSLERRPVAAMVQRRRIAGKAVCDGADESGAYRRRNQAAVALRRA